MIRKTLFLEIVLLFVFLPLSMARADWYDLKVSPSGIYAGQTVKVLVDASYEKIGTCSSMSFVWMPSCDYLTLNYGDGASETIICIAPPSVNCDDLGIARWECKCVGEFEHRYIRPSSNPYQITLIRGGSQVASKEVEVSLYPTSSVTGINPLNSTNIADIINHFSNWIFFIGAAGALLMIIIGGYYFMMAGGNPATVNKGKRIILITIIGLVILIVARGIVYFVEQVFRN